MSARTIRVAAVQVESKNGAPSENLARAESVVADAARRGAQLVICPEFLAPGYVFDESIWRGGELKGGPTETWLTRLSAAHNIYLGASYLEADGDDFYNTFTLAAPDGSIAGRVRKESIPVFEGWYVTTSTGSKVIDTPLGRIGVGICHDNQTAQFLRRMRTEQPDLIVMPHSAPCVPSAADVIREGLHEIAAFYARELGVPTILVNKVGRGWSPIPLAPSRLRLPFDFPGLSSVVDSDARVIEQLDHQVGAVVADIHLDPARKRTPPEPTGYWSHPPAHFARGYATILKLLARRGSRVYARNRKRVQAARAIADQRDHRDADRAVAHR